MYDLEIGIALQTREGGRGGYQDEFASRFSAQRLETMRTWPIYGWHGVTKPKVHVLGSVDRSDISLPSGQPYTAGFRSIKVTSISEARAFCPTFEHRFVKHCCVPLRVLRGFHLRPFQARKKEEYGKNTLFSHCNAARYPPFPSRVSAFWKSVCCN